MASLRHGVSVLIPSWNGLEHMRHCLPALERQRDPGCDWEIVVHDNGSGDGTREWMAEHHPRVRVLRSERNLGFCAANNRLVEAVDSDAVVFLNNDTRPTPEWLAALVDALASAPEDVAAVSGLIVDWQGERLDFGRGILTFDGHAFQLGYGRPRDRADDVLPATGDELLFPCGGNAIVRRRAFLEAGGFDESYFAYLEDVDLGWRLWSRGQRVLFSREAAVHHRSMATSDLLGAARRGFLFERNAFATVVKNYDREMWSTLMPVVLLTLQARLRTLMADHNPGGQALRADPYAGSSAAEPPELEPLSSVAPWHLLRRWRELGTRGFLDRARQRLAPAPPERPVAVELVDDRTLNHLRAMNAMLDSLDVLAQRREALLRERRRPDREIFERFPLWLVPTYPGDEELFASDGFRSWLPESPELREATLAEVMAT